MTADRSGRATGVELVLITADALEALVNGDLAKAGEIIGQVLPAGYLERTWLWRYRLDQIRSDPAAAPWLVRASVGQPAGTVVGHAGFHGPPDARGMVEIGYGTLPAWQGRGYAQAAVRALLAFARAHQAGIMRASVRPDNAASLAVIGGFGFEQVGEQWDDIDGLEYVFERNVNP